MKHEYALPNEIKMALHKTVYDLYSKNSPATVELVRQLLAVGKTPDQIHKIFQKKLGKNSPTALHIWNVAEYLNIQSNN
jgi:hypothetical protein